MCAVGDDDQAIYGWRGADVRNILDFEAHFPGARVVKLEQNYRSTRAHPRGRQRGHREAHRREVAQGALHRSAPAASRPTLAVAATPEVEATWVGREVRRAIRDEGRRARDIAVLYRSNGQSRLIEEALREQGVAHRVVGGTQFFERKEVKDVLAYLKLALNPGDEISLRRIVNVPARGIGDTSLERLALARGAAHGWSLWQARRARRRLRRLAERRARRVPGARRRRSRRRGSELFGEKRAPSAGRPRDGRGASGCRRTSTRARRTIDVAAKRWANVEGLLETLARREARDGQGHRRARRRSCTR